MHHLSALTVFVHTDFLKVFTSFIKILYVNWKVTVREEYRLRVFVNRMLRRIFGPKKEEDGLWLFTSG
jgi:hypothetical protein